MKFRLFIMLTLVSPVFAKAQWTPVAALPGAGADGCFSAAINGKGYVGGGTGRNTLYEYDPAANTWTQKASVPGPSQRAWSGAFTANGNLYVVGGDSTFGGLLKDVWMYEPSKDQWTRKADYPGGIRDGMFSFTFGAVNLKTKVFMGGGFDGQYILDDFYEYDPVTDHWTSLQNLPAGMLFPSVFILNNKGYVTLWEGGIYHTSLWEFDPVTYSWVEKAACPATPRSEGIGFAYSNYGYAGWGQTNFNKTYNDLYRYDPVQDEWTQLKDTLPAHHTGWSCAFVIGNVVYAGSGTTLPDFNFSNRFYKMGLVAGVGEVDAPEGPRVWLDPYSNKLNYTSAEEILRVEIIDMNGRTVTDVQPGTDHAIGLEACSGGVYTAVFYTVSNAFVRKVSLY